METKEITIEEIQPELLEAGLENKGIKKITKLGDKLLSKVNGRINAERDIVRRKLDNAIESVNGSTKSFIDTVNEDLGNFKKRYEGLYSDLVRRILVKMESRVFNVEIFQQAVLDLLVEKIYRIEKGLKPEDEIDQIDYGAYIEDCAEKHQGFMQKHVDSFMKKQNGEKDVEPVQEKEEIIEDQKAGGGQDQTSDSSDRDNVGTSDKVDGGQAQQETKAIKD